LKQKIERVLSARQAAALGIGIVIGTGIFAVPGFVAQQLQSPGPILLAWVFGGLIALSGALTHAEIAGMVPRQGGSFIFVLEAFGPWAAFFKGWGAFLIGYPASMCPISG
jgi:APA family basic amino acid/polyamine antiporter